MMDEQLKELLKKAFDEGAMYEATFSSAYSFDSFIEDNIEQLRLYGVSNRRELLIDFCSKVEETLEMYGHLAPNEAYIDEYLKGN